MNINNRIKQLQKEANAKVNKFHKVEIIMGEWCECDQSDCETCNSNDNLPGKQLIDGEIVLNVGASEYN